MKRLKWVIKEIIKYIGIRCMSMVVSLLYVFPIKQNRIILHSFNGKQYSCNPRSISEYIVKHYPNQYEIIWAFNEPNKFLFLEKDGIKIVKYRSIKRIFYEATAQISINNCGSYSWIPLRKKQMHINTWHAGGAYKKLQNDIFVDANRKKTAKETSHMLTSGTLFTKYMIQQTFNFEGEILKIGMPRNDVLFSEKDMNERAEKVKAFYKIPSDKFIVLYAPTWRFDGNIPQPDFNIITDAIKKRFDREVVIFVRNHNYSNNKCSGAVDVSEYMDMQDLLCTSDMLITDYSSSIWDYSFTNRPCFLFVNDLEKYGADPGFCTDIHNWGFPICLNNSELCDAISSFDERVFKQKMKEKHEYYGSYETGTATEKFCQLILRK